MVSFGMKAKDGGLSIVMLQNLGASWKDGDCQNSREERQSHAGKGDVNLPKILDNLRFNRLMVIFMATPEGAVSLFRLHATLLPDHRA